MIIMFANSYMSQSIILTPVKTMYTSLYDPLVCVGGGMIVYKLGLGTAGPTDCYITCYLCNTTVYRRKLVTSLCNNGLYSWVALPVLPSKDQTH